MEPDAGEHLRVLGGTVGIQFHGDIDHILPRKLQAAADYAERATLWTDLKIIARTLRLLIARA